MLNDVVSDDESDLEKDGSVVGVHVLERPLLCDRVTDAINMEPEVDVEELRDARSRFALHRVKETEADGVRLFA